MTKNSDGKILVKDKAKKKRIKKGESYKPLRTGGVVCVCLKKASFSFFFISMINMAIYDIPYDQK